MKLAIAFPSLSPNRMSLITISDRLIPEAPVPYRFENTNVMFCSEI